MLNILKNITSLIKKNLFFTFVVVCLLILMCINSNCLQIIEGKRGRIKKRYLQNDAIKNNKNAIKKNKQKIITLFSKLYNTNNNDTINKTVGKPTIGLQIGKK